MTPQHLSTCIHLSLTHFRAHHIMPDFVYQFDVLYGFLYQLPFHIFHLYLMCVLTYLNFDIWRSLWSLIYAIRASHSLASSIDWMLRVMRQVNTFAGVEKTKYHSGWSGFCPALIQQREKWEGGKYSRTTQLIRKDIYSNMKLHVSAYDDHLQVSIPIKGSLYRVFHDFRA